MPYERIFFLNERLNDLTKGIPRFVDFPRHVEEGIRALSEFCDYLQHVEKGRDEPLQGHYPFYLEISLIAEYSDDFLSRFNNPIDNWYVRDEFPSFINILVSKVRKLHHLLLSQSNYNINTGGNTNMSGQLSTGPIHISIHHSETSHIKRVVRPNTYGHIPNSDDLVGFNGEILILLDHLLQPHDETCVVGIVGMGGSGKTTLAKYIYHHPQINTHFTRKVWVCVSQSWEKVHIINAIWRQATGNTTAAEMDYERVVQRLYQFLSSETYLVILDDIWSIHAWYDISPALPNGNGSKVVITTRNKILPQHIDSHVHIVEPKQLDDEESFELFKRRASLPYESIPRDLLALGMQMIKKCKGLPLAIIALAGVLQMNISLKSWKSISEKLTHNILNTANKSTQGVVKEVLALSYYELPLHLKHCVLYLRVFPEDYEIEAQKLIQMWIAECFMDDESIAKDYLQEIVDRCIVEVVKTNYNGQVRRFRIHDLIRQMFVDINQGGFCKDIRLSPSKAIYGDQQNNNTPQISQMTSIEYLERILRPQKNSHARSIIFLNYLFLSESLLNRLFAKFRALRVLILSHFVGSEMPQEIGNLIHLRYLELGGLIKLPASMGSLVNLWTLNLRYLFFGDWNRTTVSNLYQLKELRHLYLPQQGSDWGEIAVHKTKLKILWNARGGEWMLLGMLVLSNVLQELCIHNIKSNEQLQAVFGTPSITLNYLETLELMWDDIGVELFDMRILGDCRSLEKLKLGGRIGVSTQIMFPSNIIKLEMTDTLLEEREVMNIISNSCPHLRVLVLRDEAYMGSELVCNARSFPQLEKLIFEGLVNLKLWTIEESAMPRLHYLTIKRCENMDLNHEGWKRVSEIPRLECEDLSPEFEEKLGDYRKDDMDPSQNRDVSTSLSLGVGSSHKSLVLRNLEGCSSLFARCFGWQ